MKKFIIFFVLLAINVQAQKADLKFNNDGRFKIVQFTDLHMRLDDQRSDTAFYILNHVLETEKPDLVILTGDMIYNKPAEQNLRNLLSVFERRKQPFAVTFGNHDQEQGLTNEQLFDIVKSMKYNHTKTTPNISGVGNCTIDIRSHTGDSTSLVLYCFDSGRKSHIDEVKGYAMIRFDQINWYRNQSKTYTQQAKHPLPSLAFFHIPLPEYGYAVADSNASLYGIRREKACASALNSGLFASMKEMGDVMGIFVGHDHDNDYAVNYHDILLAYGRFSGGPTEYIHIPNGARVIEVAEGTRTFRTWIRTAHGVEQITEFPKDYKK